MLVTCGWCGKVLGAIPAEGPKGTVSTGICASCVQIHFPRFYKPDTVPTRVEEGQRHGGAKGLNQ
jgi:hypothetical protein